MSFTSNVDINSSAQDLPSTQKAVLNGVASLGLSNDPHGMRQFLWRTDTCMQSLLLCNQIGLKLTVVANSYQLKSLASIPYESVHEVSWKRALILLNLSVVKSCLPSSGMITKWWIKNRRVGTKKITLPIDIALRQYNKSMLAVKEWLLLIQIQKVVPAMSLWNYEH